MNWLEERGGVHVHGNLLFAFAQFFGQRRQHLVEDVNVGCFEHDVPTILVPDY